MTNSVLCVSFFLYTKILMQKSRLSEIDWDAAVPFEIHTPWRDYETQLSALDKIQVNRIILIDNHASLPYNDIYGNA